MRSGVPPIEPHQSGNSRLSLGQPSLQKDNLVKKKNRGKLRQKKATDQRARLVHDVPDELDGSDRDLHAVFARSLAGERRFKIAYFLPHEDQDLRNATFFGWYTPGLIEAAGALRLASVLPADIREPFARVEEVLALRQARLITPMIIPIQASDMFAAAAFLETPFRVYITSNEPMANAVDEMAKDFETPILHFSTAPGDARLPFSGATVARVCLFVRTVLGALAAEPSWSEFVQFARQAIRGASLRRAVRHPLPKGLHNVVLPNELSLIAFGRKLTTVDRISEPGITAMLDPNRYVQRICLSADAVTEERRRLMEQMSFGVVDHRMILATAGAYWGIFKRWRKMIRDAPPEVKKGVAHALAAVVQGGSYFDAVQADDEGNPVIEAAYAQLTQIRAMEMAAFSSALAMLSTKSLVPVLRLEPKLNEARGAIKLLAHCVRSEARHQHDWKISRLTRALGAQMRSLIHPSFLTRIDAPEPDGKIEGVKLVSDLPLELMPSEGVPLGLRFDVSRLSPVPGNLLIQQCMGIHRQLNTSDFEEVLVIRSFKETDPLKDVFWNAVDSVQTSEGKLRIKYRFVDVQSTDEFAAALNGYHGAMLIFDGHGKYDDEYGIGSLVLGDEVLDAWSLRGTCRMPPIVMFSACDTYPIDGSQGSVAMAALTLGAIAVLGTMFPIGAVEAAVFNARLALRIQEYIPIVLEAKRLSSVTWRTVVSGMLRMHHTQELLRRLMSPAIMGLTIEDVMQVQMAANTSINAQQADWYAGFERNVANRCGHSVGFVREVISKHAGLTDAMKYVHLGNPEDIAIVRSVPDKVLRHLGLSEADHEAAMTEPVGRET